MHASGDVCICWLLVLSLCCWTGLKCWRFISGRRLLLGRCPSKHPIFSQRPVLLGSLDPIRYDLRLSPCSGDSQAGLGSRLRTVELSGIHLLGPQLFIDFYVDTLCTRIEIRNEVFNYHVKHNLLDPDYGTVIIKIHILHRRRFFVQYLAMFLLTVFND